jgi:hypothetical protein
MSDVVVICSVGDSTTFAGISWYYQANNVPSSIIFDESSSPRRSLRSFPSSNRIVLNMALSGWRISNLESQATELDSFINQNYSTKQGRPRRHNILAVRIGTNITSTDPAVAAARVRSYCLARQAAGWKVIICPIWSLKIGSTVYDTTYVQPQNAIFATWGESDGVAAVVPATSSLIYGTNAHANLTYFSDGIHPTSLGHSIAASEYLTVQENLISQLTA